MLMLKLVCLSAVGDFEFAKDGVLLLDFVLEAVVLFRELVQFADEIALLRFVHLLLCLKLGSLFKSVFLQNADLTFFLLQFLFQSYQYFLSFGLVVQQLGLQLHDFGFQCLHRFLICQRQLRFLSINLIVLPCFGFFFFYFFVQVFDQLQILSIFGLKLSLLFF
jgi:hypothetical protein